MRNRAYVCLGLIAVLLLALNPVVGSAVMVAEEVLAGDGDDAETIVYVAKAGRSITLGSAATFPRARSERRSRR